jgi:hypothetical protein
MRSLGQAPDRMAAELAEAASKTPGLRCPATIRLAVLRAAVTTGLVLGDIIAIRWMT